MAAFFTDGAVELFYDNSKKFETTSNGATVTGKLSATSYRDTTYTLTGTEIDPDNGGIQTKVAGANTTFTFASGFAAGDSVVLHLEGGSSYTITWPDNDMGYFRWKFCTYLDSKRCCGIMEDWFNILWCLCWELCIMNNFKKMLAVCGNSVVGGASPWGYTHTYQGLGLVNSKITITNDDLVCFGGYNAGAASIKKDGSAVNWSKEYTGPVITHSTYGNETPSYGNIKSYNRPLVLSSTKTIFEQNGVWLWTSPSFILPVYGI